MNDWIDRTTPQRGARPKSPMRQGARARTAPPRAKPRKELGYTLNDDGAKRLICAVMEQAVVDFKMLVSHGRIVNGKAMPSKRNEIVDGYENQENVKQLLHFFEAGGPMDMWLLVAGIKINPNLIRLKLGISS